MAPHRGTIVICHKYEPLLLGKQIYCAAFRLHYIFEGAFKKSQYTCVSFSMHNINIIYLHGKYQLYTRQATMSGVRYLSSKHLNECITVDILGHK